MQNTNITPGTPGDTNPGDQARGGTPRIGENIYAHRGRSLSPRSAM